jgi:hypothetical protein
MSTYSKFYFRPGRGEQVNTEIMPEQDRCSAICGRVVDGKSRAVENALVLLFRTGEEREPSLLSRFCTDEDGHFMFGPLESDALYLIKVFKNDVKIRELEIRAE